MRLSDVFMELMSYTAHLMRQIEKGEMAAYEDVRRLYDLLYERALRRGQEGGYPEEDQREAWFAVCAWIDEMLLCSEWPGKGQWESRQLQRIHFQTVNGGEEFFSRLQDLPEERGQVREVYLYCLAMGFKGRFFAPEDEKKLAQIRQKNLLLIHDLEELNDAEPIFPEAYSTTTLPEKRTLWHRGLSAFHVLVIAVSGLCVAALFLTYKNILDNLVQAYLGN